LENFAGFSHNCCYFFPIYSTNYFATAAGYRRPYFPHHLVRLGIEDADPVPIRTQDSQRSAMQAHQTISIDIVKNHHGIQITHTPNKN
jgi:hypothetical protein